MTTMTLEGAHIVVTRPAGRGESLCARIQTAGGDAFNFPVIEIRPVAGVNLPDDAPEWLVFTSVAAVEHGTHLLAGINARRAAIGNATAAAMRGAGIEPDAVPGRQESEGLLALSAFEDIAGKNVWIIKGRGGRKLLANTLRERGATVNAVEVYERCRPDADIEPLLERWRTRRVDAIAVSSRAGLENLHAMLDAEGRRHLGETQLVVPTERMLKLALELDIRPAPIIAADASDDALLTALSNWWRDRRQDSPMNNDTQAEKSNDKPTSPPAEKPSAKPSAPKKPKRGGTAGAVASLVLLLLVIGGLAVAGWYGWQWLSAEKAEYDRVIEAQTATISRLESRLERIEETRVSQDDFEELRDRLNATRTNLRDRMEVIANDMNALREAAQGGRRDLVRAEIEYLLRIAADALYLTQDVDTAIYALQAADDRLQQLSEPRLMPVRQLVADHLQELGAINKPDVTGMALKLNSLMREVSGLPLRQAQHARAVDEIGSAAPADAGWWQRLRRGVARLFDKLVIVQRADPPPPLLKPEEHFFLYRNVELQLASARAALMSGDVTAYRQGLETAREWLNRYFDTADPAVGNAIDDISGLLDVTLQPELPDITPALTRFRTLTGDTLRPAGARTE